LVDVAHAPAWLAAAAVGVRMAAGFVGDLALIPLLARVPGRRVMGAGAVVAGISFPAFLLLPGSLPKMAALGVLSLATCPWYPLLEAELFGCLEGQSGVAVTLSSVAALAGALGPLAVGYLAETWSLTGALATLGVVPLVVLAGLSGGRPGPPP
ncbi:MAG: hypothetical protein ACRDYC_10090, partial [Acidimicrobiales bacterium]